MKQFKKDKQGTASPRKKCIAVLLLLILMSMSLSACSSSSKDTNNASGPAVELDTEANYVKTYLDALCKQDYEPYAKAYDASLNEVKEDVPEYIKGIIESEFTYIPSDTMITAFAKTLQKLFGKCRYTVSPSVQNEDGSYSIPVSIEKFSVFKTSLEKAEKDYDAWKKQQSDDMDADAMTDKYYEFITKYCEEELKNPKYEDAATITVTLSISEEDENVYEYGDEDINSLLYGLIDLSAWDELVDENEEEAE